jgi:hemerythrin-like metal-binding protein
MWFSKGKPEPEPPFFSWSAEEHSVGVSVFDQEHQRLAALMSQIHASLQTNHDRGKAQRLLESFIAMAQEHFDHEERIMANIDYPDLAAHAAEHEALMEQAKAMFQRVQHGNISALTIPGFLKTWLIHHMQQTDRKYAAHMRRNGMK